MVLKRARQEPASPVWGAHEIEPCLHLSRAAMRHRTGSDCAWPAVTSHAAKLSDRVYPQRTKNLRLFWVLSVFTLSPLHCKTYCGKGATDRNAHSGSILLVFFQELADGPGVTNTDKQNTPGFHVHFGSLRDGRQQHLLTFPDCVL